MAKFYFTFGTNKVFPHQGGWVEVEADSMNQAIDKFSHKYGHTKQGNGRYSFCYPEKEFLESEMSKTHNLGARLRASIK